MGKIKEYIEDQKFVSWVFNPNEETSRFFDDYLNEFPEEKERLLKAKRDLEFLAIRELKPSFSKGIEIYQNILNQIKKHEQTDNKITLLQILQYAAIAIVFFTIGSVLMTVVNLGNNDFQLVEEQLFKGAHHYPMLYLADGSGLEITQKQIDFSIANKCIIGDDTIGVPNKDEMNVMVVPYGQRVQMVLNDGSHVLLNAGSRLIFPSKFENGGRKVFISGEAYFDIIHNEKSPFLVNTSTVSVKVLGTKFNLEAYADEKNVVTTLEKGHVQIIDDKLFFSKLKADLKPGQTAVYNKVNQTTEVNNISYELHTLWKDGILKFENLPVEQLVKKIERYYNIQIDLNDPNVLSEKLRGKLDLNAGKNEVLEYISKITNAKINEVNRSRYILK